MNAITPINRHPDHAVDAQFPSRWSPRAFAADTISEETLLGLLEAARWAPSAMNVQPWRFAWGLRGDAAFAGLFEALVPGNQAWAGNAAALVAIASKPTRTTHEGEEVAFATHAFDTGAAWASLALQAHLSGYISHGMGGFDPAKLAAATHLPAGYVLHAVIAIGRPGNPADLSEALRAREVPSSRHAITDLAANGHFPA